MWYLVNLLFCISCVLHYDYPKEGNENTSTSFSMRNTRWAWQIKKHDSRSVSSSARRSQEGSLISILIVNTHLLLVLAV